MAKDPEDAGRLIAAAIGKPGAAPEAPETGADPKPQTEAQLKTRPTRHRLPRPRPLNEQANRLDDKEPGRTEMKIHTKDFRVTEGDKVDLKKWPTKINSVYKSKKQYKKLLDEHVEQLSAQQQLLYADNRHAILLIFQAMDAAGKDGAIRHVMSGVNPQGCQVFSFKHPSAAELEHDFLWRTTRDLPGRGKIGIFNRSYYEEVLITRVHPEILRNEGLPDAALEKKRSGGAATVLSSIWNDTFTKTGHASSNSFCICQRRNSASGFSHGSMSRRRIGSSAPMT
jgi:hypothetical protein